LQLVAMAEVRGSRNVTESWPRYQNQLTRLEVEPLETIG